MLCAVVGFIVFSYYNIFVYRITSLEYIAYGLILLPAIFWILLATKYLLTKKVLYRILTILSLVLTAGGSLYVSYNILSKYCTFVSSIFFAIQTVIWDAICWSIYFK